MERLTSAAFSAWLDAYGAAWADKDPDAAAALFAENGRLAETPFGPPARGRAAIRELWVEKVVKRQLNPTFAHEVWITFETIGIARWRASFTRSPSHAHVALDGVFRCRFELSEGRPLCLLLEDWRHMAETPFG